MVLEFCCLLLVFILQFWSVC